MEKLKIKEMRDTCLVFNQFMIDKFNIPSELKQAYQESNKQIEEAYTKNEVKPLKIMLSDINEQVKLMPLQLALELKKQLKEKLNIDFGVVEDMRIKSINKLLKKRKISKPEEYELLLERADEIHADTSKIDELKLLNELLAAYHKL